MSLERRILAATGATDLRRIERLQDVWSGWGELARYALVDGSVETVVVKRIAPGTHHPRGWSGSAGNARKRRSYEVEAAFYGTRHAGPRRAHAWLANPDLFVLEDLDAAGFATRHTMDRVPEQAVRDGLAWLAAFHAAHLDDPGDDLWPTGTYWHLATRRDEWAVMEHGPLRDGAAAIDARLRSASRQTLVHGDAKVANLCFGRSGVAAVDFQYVGCGPGIVDVVYFVGSCFSGGLADRAPVLVDHYLDALAENLSPEDLTVCDEWRSLEDFAWADFERFLAGWAPDHRKRTGYAADRTRVALRRL